MSGVLPDEDAFDEGFDDRESRTAAGVIPVSSVSVWSSTTQPLPRARPMGELASPMRRDIVNW